MGQRIRVGAVNYLNTKPLVEGLTTFAPAIDLSFDLPGRLSDRMARGELDVGLIPVVELFRAGSYSVVPVVAIASRGPVLSVSLFCRVPWAEFQSVALDEGSRTSAALAQVLLRKRYGISPRVEQLPIDAPADDLSADAVLLIGDRAMRACLPGFPFAYDLGQEWADWTGLPFVYAVWAVREGVDLRGVDQALRACRDYGLAKVGPIAAREAARLGLDPGFCRRYLSNILSFDLGPRELAGLRKFHELAHELGLAPRGVDLDFYGTADLVESR